ncbi:hypothetical protein BGZ76_010637 [Entomortierella beljakovae]|nr:hypothetical protein BGZ76_010637 [Entomortierella beljakovae]
MPKDPKCSVFDAKSCSLPPEKRNAQHLNRYHSNHPARFYSPYTKKDVVVVYRDANQGHYYPCLHPDCNHISILSSDPISHHRTCKMFKRDYPLESYPTRLARPSRSSTGKDIQEITDESENQSISKVTATTVSIHPDMPLETLDQLGKMTNYLQDIRDLLTQSTRQNAEFNQQVLQILTSHSEVSAGMANKINDIAQEISKVREVVRDDVSTVNNIVTKVREDVSTVNKCVTKVREVVRGDVSAVNYNVTKVREDINSNRDVLSNLIDAVHDVSSTNNIMKEHMMTKEYKYLDLRKHFETSPKTTHYQGFESNRDRESVIDSSLSTIPSHYIPDDEEDLDKVSKIANKTVESFSSSDIEEDSHSIGY